MIELDIIDIHSVNDYDSLTQKVKLEYIHQRIIEELKNRIGTRITQIVIEYPYYDSDYLSTYYLFYSKKLRNFDKKGYRIHFLKNKEYCGYITLRPTVLHTQVGKSYLHPSLTLEKSAFMLSSEFSANILGKVASVDSYPWMYQETDISVCAHVAVWNISRYYGNKYKNYNCFNMGDITERINEYIGRKVPSDGLNIIQISNVLRQLGFSPLVIEKFSGKEQLFYEELYSYIESGIPCIGILHGNFHHAITFVGHGETIPGHLTTGQNSSYDYIDSLVAVDDNYFPFISVNKDITAPKIQKYSLSDISYVLAPLYDRMQYGYRSVKYQFDQLYNSKSYNFPSDFVHRIYLTSANSLKREASKNVSMNIILNAVILKLELPKFVWCIDLSAPQEFLAGKTSARILIDSTCSSNEQKPWLLIHDDRNIVYRSDDLWYSISEVINSYDMYTNNLRRFEP